MQVAAGGNRLLAPAGRAHHRLSAASIVSESEVVIESLDLVARYRRYRYGPCGESVSVSKSLMIMAGGLQSPQNNTANQSIWGRSKITCDYDPADQNLRGIYRRFSGTLCFLCFLLKMTSLQGVYRTGEELPCPPRTKMSGVRPKITYDYSPGGGGQKPHRIISEILVRPVRTRTPVTSTSHHHV